MCVVEVDVVYHLAGPQLPADDCLGDDPVLEDALDAGDWAGVRRYFVTKDADASRLTGAGAHLLTADTLTLAGNFAAATKALRAAGYGSPAKPKAPEQAGPALTLIHGGETGSAPTDGTAAVKVDQHDSDLPAIVTTTYTDQGNADLLAERHGHRLRYVPARAQCAISLLHWEGYDAVVIPGGFESPDRLRERADVCDFVRSMWAHNKLVAAIAPQIFLDPENGNDAWDGLMVSKQAASEGLRVKYIAALEASLDSLEQFILKAGEPTPASGRQELLEIYFNDLLNS